jgi:hypothetical protein
MKIIPADGVRPDNSGIASRSSGKQGSRQELDLESPRRTRLLNKPKRWVSLHESRIRLFGDINMKKFFALLAVAVIVVSAPAAQAAVINVQPRIVGILDAATFAPVPGAVFTDKQYVKEASVTTPVVAQVDIYMNVESLGAGEDSFGTAAFTVTYNGVTGATVIPDPEAGGYAANPIPNVDSNGAAPGGLVPLFATNADLGADSQDYIGILVQMATGAFTNAADPRRSVGEAGSSLGSPILLGSAFFEWNGLGIANLTLNPVEVSAKDTTGLYVQGTASPVIGVTLIGVPEPGTMAMAGLSVLGLAFRRRLA